MTVVLTRRYTPLGTAKELFARREPEVLVSGPAGTGKSRACMEKLHRIALLNPGMRGLIVRKTASSLGSTALVTWREHVAKEALAVGDVEFYGGSAQEAAQYRYTNGSVIVIGGMDKSTKIMSSEYDVIYVQEATELTENDWEALTTRLRNGVVSFQQLLADCNPAQPTHWLKVRCDKGLTTMLYAKHTDNPVLFQNGQPTEKGRAYLETLERLSGVRKLRLEKGIWAAAEGLIYDEYDPAVHLIDPFPIPESWTRYWAIDFGFTNPFVCQMWAEDPDGRLYLYREIYHTRKTVDQHCADIAKTVMRDAHKPAGDSWRGTWTEPRPRAVVADHDAEGRAVFQRELGLSVTAANKKVTEGIQAVQRRLRLADDGKPRLYLFRDAVIAIDKELQESSRPVSTVDEIVGYIWDVKPGDKVQEVPRKEDDHGQDAKRYLVAHRDLKGRPRVRFM